MRAKMAAIDQQIRDDARTRQELNERVMALRIKAQEEDEVEKELKLQCTTVNASFSFARVFIKLHLPLGTDSV